MAGAPHGQPPRAPQLPGDVHQRQDRGPGANLDKPRNDDVDKSSSVTASKCTEGASNAPGGGGRPGRSGSAGPLVLAPPCVRGGGISLSTSRPCSLKRNSHRARPSRKLLRIPRKERNRGNLIPCLHAAPCSGLFELKSLNHLLSQCCLLVEHLGMPCPHLFCPSYKTWDVVEYFGDDAGVWLRVG